MSRLVPILCAGCAVAIGITAYSSLAHNPADAIAVPKGTPANPNGAAPDALASALHTARRQCSMPALDAIVQQLQQHADAAATDRDAFHLLAEALLERVQQRSHLRGMSVGTPIYAELPTALEADLTAGLAAIARARELGDDSGALFRIEAGLMGQRITGLASALRWNGKIQAALAKAGERAKDDPQLHVTLGLHKLLAPKLLGQDLEHAIEHFEYAARALADDERPAVFAAMASYLQKKRQQAIMWLEQAVARNANNTFARVVLQRVRRGEENAFGRDVTSEEVAASK